MKTAIGVAAGVLLCAAGVVRGQVELTGTVQQAGSSALGSNTVALGTGTFATGTNALSAGTATEAEGENAFAAGFFARVRPQDSNAFIFATGEPGVSRESFASDAAFLERLFLFSPAVDDFRAVLTRGENDARYDVRYLQPTGSGAGLTGLNAGALTNFGAGFGVSGGVFRATGDFDGQNITNVATIYVRERVVTANLDVHDTVTVRRTLMVMGPPTVVSNGAANVEPGGAVLAYDFDVDFSAANSVSDLSTNGNHAAIEAGAVWTNAGHAGGGLVLDGVGGRLEAANSASLALDGAFTLSAWLKPELPANAGCPTILAMGANGAPSYALVWAPNDGGRLILAVSGSAGYQTIWSSADSVPEGMWTHVAAVVDAASNAVIYINGKTNAMGSISTPVPQAASPLLIGKWTDGAYYYKGEIDSLRIHNRALTEGEAEDLAQGGGGLSYIYSNALLRASGTNITLRGRTTIENAVIQSLEPQGDISMGSFTSRP